MKTLGIDTSNYTTSLALFCGGEGRNEGRLLDVPEGALGLRQSDALFSHVKRLPQLMEKLLSDEDLRDVSAIAASTRPRAVEGSYMPCFLAGESLGRSLALALNVPFFSVSHQQGHIAAAAWSAGRMDLLDKPHLAWHLSGGTTELLLVEPDGKNLSARCIGGTTDLSAGQLVDRTGKALGLAFPAGKALDALWQTAEKRQFFSVKLQDLSFSLSGLENKMQELLKREPAEEVAYFALRSVAEAVVKTTRAARERYPDLPVICSGGVASNQLLRLVLAEQEAIFAQPAYSTDNAMGVAILAERLGGSYAGT